MFRYLHFTYVEVNFYKSSVHMYANHSMCICYITLFHYKSVCIFYITALLCPLEEKEKDKIIGMYVYACIPITFSMEFYYVRFMAEPDLAPLVLAGKDVSLSGSEIEFPLAETITNVDKLRSGLPELPMQTRSKLNAQYGIILICLCMYNHSVPYAYFRMVIYAIQQNNYMTGHGKLG